MSDLYKVKVEFDLVTNYNPSETKEVLERVLLVPFAEYIDCYEFDYKNIKVVLNEKKRKNKKNIS